MMMIDYFHKWRPPLHSFVFMLIFEFMSASSSKRVYM